MDEPDIKHTLLDPKSGVTWEIMAYRQMTTEEQFAAIHLAWNGMKKSARPKRGQKLTIITLYGADEQDD